MSYAATHHHTTQLGGQAFNHDQSSEAEAEYDRLRELARQEHDKRTACFDKSHKAYERGDGQGAHELSEEGKRHGAMMEQYNKQASDFIFRENNAVDHVASDTIDLHGQFVEEAEDILEARIKYAQQHGQTHLHVIVGKGNHSVNHVQKIKPRVEQICQELGLQYATEENAGRIYVNLQGGPAVMPPLHQGGTQQHAQHNPGGQYQQSGTQQGGYQPGAYPGQQQQQQGEYHGQEQYGGGQAQNYQEQQIEAAIEKMLPKIIRKCGDCCIVM